MRGRWGAPRSRWWWGGRPGGRSPSQTRPRAPASRARRRPTARRDRARGPRRRGRCRSGSASGAASPCPWLFPPYRGTVLRVALVVRVAFYIVGEHPELIREGLDGHAEGILEEAREVCHGAGFAFALGELGEPDEIEDQRRRQDRVAALPDEVHAHLRPEKSAEVNEVPRRFPVAERRDVLDRHAGVRRIAECGAKHAGFTSELGALVAGVGPPPPPPPPPRVEGVIPRAPPSVALCQPHRGAVHS